jgi:hypothetical protein
LKARAGRASVRLRIERAIDREVAVMSGFRTRLSLAMISSEA